MSIQTQIDRLKSAKDSIIAAIKGKGVSVPSTAKMGDLGALISIIPQESVVSPIKVETGTYTFTSNMAGNSSATSSSYYKQINHNLGTTPDLVIFYAPANVSQTYSMLLAMRGNATAWRSGYESICAYHGNSNSTVTLSNVTTNYGISVITDTYFRVRTYSSSNSYYWRTGTYNWVAIKFG